MENKKLEFGIILLILMVVISSILLFKEEKKKQRINFLECLNYTQRMNCVPTTPAYANSDHDEFCVFAFDWEKLQWCYDKFIEK